MQRGMKRMQKAALALEPVISHTDGLPIHFLTGKNYLYQTLFCIRSLTKTTDAHFKFILIDDGTFDADLIELVQRLLPNAEIIGAGIIKKNIAQNIPPSCTALLEKRKVYPHIRKLTDIHTLPGNAWKLVMDSDMIFWAEPKEVLSWIEKPDSPLYMRDCMPSYGYTDLILKELLGKQLPELVNVGVIGLNSDYIDWQRLDEWIKILESREGTSYYLEQALTAMIIGDHPSTILAENEYIVNPDEQLIKRRKGILHHYVDLSKKEYFIDVWKNI